MGDGRGISYASMASRVLTAASTPDNPGKAGVGYKIRLKESDGKQYVGKLHKYRPSDKMHFVMWPDSDGHWVNLSDSTWAWEGTSPQTEAKPAAKPSPPASQNPTHDDRIQMGKPNHLELDHAWTRFESALYKRAKGDRGKAQQLIDNRTKATKTAEKLNAWYFTLREQDGFEESAHKALTKLREMGYEGYTSKGWRP